MAIGPNTHKGMPSIIFTVSADKWQELIQLAGLQEDDEFLYVNERRQFVVIIKPEE